MAELNYPQADEIIEINILALGLVKVKKADKHQVLSYQKIISAVSKAEGTEGDLYLKAAVLMRELSRAHCFASGNRRTAFLATKDFVIRNSGKFVIPDDPDYANVMRGIREGTYSETEISEWISNGKINKRGR